MDDRALLTILRCADKTDGQVGRSGLLKVLLGCDSRKLSKLKLDHLDEYGSLSTMRRSVVLEHIDSLIERGCLAVDTFFFPMLNVTEVGKNRMERMVHTYGSSILPDRKIEAAHVCDEKEFWELFPQDLQRAKQEVIIVSPFVSRHRVMALLENFKGLLERGVAIRLYLRPIEHSDRAHDEKAMVLDSLKSMGIKVSLREAIHHKVAIIDHAVAWEGSLNILQHWDSGEQMTRHDDPEYVSQLIDVLTLKNR